MVERLFWYSLTLLRLVLLACVLNIVWNQNARLFWYNICKKRATSNNFFLSFITVICCKYKWRGKNDTTNFLKGGLFYSSSIFSLIFFWYIFITSLFSLSLAHSCIAFIAKFIALIKHCTEYQKHNWTLIVFANSLVNIMV